MKTLEISNQLIINQIEGRTAIMLVFADDKENGKPAVEPLDLYAQWDKEGKMQYWVKPLFCRYKKITEEKYNEFLAMIEYDTKSLDEIGEDLSYKMVCDFCAEGYIVVRGNEVDDTGFDTFFENHYNDL